MYKSVTDRYIPPMADIAEHTKCVADTPNLEMSIPTEVVIGSTLRYVKELEVRSGGEE